MCMSRASAGRGARHSQGDRDGRKRGRERHSDSRTRRCLGTGRATVGVARGTATVARGTGRGAWCILTLDTAARRSLRATETIVKNHPHALRHSHASALIPTGQDVVTVSRRLGHASPTSIGLGVNFRSSHFILYSLKSGTVSGEGGIRTQGTITRTTVFEF
jgi:integrase-like protein